MDNSSTTTESADVGEIISFIHDMSRVLLSGESPNEIEKLFASVNFALSAKWGATYIGEELTNEKCCWYIANVKFPVPFVIYNHAMHVWILNDDRNFYIGFDFPEKCNAYVFAALEKSVIPSFQVTSPESPQDCNNELAVTEAISIKYRIFGAMNTMFAKCTVNSMPNQKEYSLHLINFKLPSNMVGLSSRKSATKKKKRSPAAASGSTSRGESSVINYKVDKYQSVKLFCLNAESKPNKASLFFGIILLELKTWFGHCITEFSQDVWPVSFDYNQTSYEIFYPLKANRFALSLLEVEQMYYLSIRLITTVVEENTENITNSNSTKKTVDVYTFIRCVKISQLVVPTLDSKDEAKDRYRLQFIHPWIDWIHTNILSLERLAILKSTYTKRSGSMNTLSSN